MSFALSEEENLHLSGKEWKPLPRVSKTIPFGYAVTEGDPDTLVPVILELEALEKAKQYRTQGHSLRKVAEWLSRVSKRSISHVGLDRRLKVDRARRGKVATLRRWAAAYKEAILKVKEWDEKNNEDIDIWQSLFDPSFDPERWGATTPPRDRRNVSKGDETS
jgi:hypothetical protein